MPVRHIENTDLEYQLLCCDKDGVERPEKDGSLSSKGILAQLVDPTQAITDVFVMSHGWKGDVPAAVEQYDRWVAAMAACEADRARARERWPDFKALLIGFHWPSQPWGNEKTDGSFDVTAASHGEQSFVEVWSDLIADSEAARNSLRVLYAEARKDIEPDRLPASVVEAYRTLEREAQLGADGVAGAPDADRRPLDPQTAYEDWSTIEAGSFDGSFLGGMLSVLRQLSFWSMKRRARVVGEHAGRSLIDAIAATGRARVHLMGHSFGCIVVSGMLRRAGMGDVKVDTVLLAQGAMSLWSCAKDLPGAAGTPGYFRPVIENRCVKGPLIVTTSKFDRAVGNLYPLAAGAASQVDYAPGAEKLPKFGAIGTFGLRGEGLELESTTVASDLGHTYGFAPGRIYNLKCDEVIKNGSGLSGAHNDIAHPQLGHVFWEAVLATPGN